MLRAGSVCKLALLASLGLGASACAVPHGSFARPVVAPPEGASLVGAGVMVPVVVAESDESSEGLSSLEDLPRVGQVVPTASFDHHLSSRHTLGVEAGYIDTEFGGFLLLHPRWELALNSTLSLTGDLALGLGRSIEGPGSFAQLSLTFGVRLYFPTGFGGFVLSQQMGTGIATFYAPGSVAYDIPIVINERFTLHIFPEFRWDPTINYGVPAYARWFVFGSAGVGTMLQF